MANEQMRILMGGGRHRPFNIYNTKAAYALPIF